jgi:hypothetical protein
MNAWISIIFTLYHRCTKLEIDNPSPFTGIDCLPRDLESTNSNTRGAFATTEYDLHWHRYANRPFDNKGKYISSKTYRSSTSYTRLKVSEFHIQPRAIEQLHASKRRQSILMSL